MKQNISSRILERRRIIRAFNLSDTLPDDTTISDEQKRVALGKSIEKFLADFEDVYTHLLNNVRVNMPKQFKPISDNLSSLHAISDMNQEDITSAGPSINTQITAIKARIAAAANAVKRIMNTIVQECNDLKNSMKTACLKRKLK